MLRITAIILLATLASAAANAASDGGSQSQSLSTQRGIGKGQRNATELHTGPVAPGGLMATQPASPAYDQQFNGGGQYPLIVAPYIEVPGYSPQPNPPRPHPPRPVPHGR